MNGEDSRAGQRRSSPFSALNILLGVWLIVSPFVLAFHHLTPAVWNNVAVGILVGLFALFRNSGGYDEPGWSWCNAILGLWLVVSPWALGFASTGSAMVNNLVAGGVIALLAFISAMVARPAITRSGPTGN
jgi:hypothetical protein